jgi:hypothetical protein
MTRRRCSRASPWRDSSACYDSSGISPSKCSASVTVLGVRDFVWVSERESERPRRRVCSVKFSDFFGRILLRPTATPWDAAERLCFVFTVLVPFRLRFLRMLAE